ncbi:MAG: hypothetical protein M3R63_19965 [Actinomycetota bacterium]|nr:hypothetical protein [Actinomycetota bacterium]
MSLGAHLDVVQTARGDLGDGPARVCFGALSLGRGEPNRAARNGLRVLGQDRAGTVRAAPSARARRVASS